MTRAMRNPVPDDSGIQTSSTQPPAQIPLTHSQTNLANFCNNPDYLSLYDLEELKANLENKLKR